MLKRLVRRLWAVRSRRELSILLRAPFLLAWRRFTATAPGKRVRAELRMRVVAWNTRHVAGPQNARAGPEQLAVVCLVRDGAPFVRDFVAHYRALGAAQIVLLDNGSRDETLALALAHPDVTVLSCPLPYREYKNEPKRCLIRRFGRRRWSLCVDIDELFDYPGSARLPLAGLLRYLRHYGYNAVVGQMLDMFAAEPAQPGGEPDERGLRERFPLAQLAQVEATPYERYYGRVNSIGNPAIMALRGGVRKALFGTDVYLTKHPLIFLEAPVQPITPSAHGVCGARVADLSCVLYHYKFTEGFADQVRRAVAEENYYRSSIEYKQYLAVLECEPALSFDLPGAWPVASADELVERGFLAVSDQYLRWVARAGPLPREQA